MAQPRHIIPRRFSDAVSEHVEYLLSVRENAPNTVRATTSILRRAERELGDPMVYNLDRKVVNRYVATRGRELARGSTNQVKTKLRVFLTWCEVEHYLDPNRHVAFDLKWKEEKPAVRHRLTADRFDLLHDAMTCRRDRMLSVFLTETLMRSSEATSCRWGQMDLAIGEILFRRWKTDKRTDTKPTARLPISMVLDRELRSYRDWYEQKIGREVTADDYILCSIRLDLRGRGDQTVTKTDDTIMLIPEQPVVNTHTIIQDALFKIGFDGEQSKASRMHKEGAHTLRRSAARELLEALFRDPELAQDEALLMVMTMLGHANLEMTLRYIGYDRDQDKVMRVLRGKDWWAFARPAPVIQLAPTGSEN